MTVLLVPSSTGVEPEYSLRRDLFPHHLSSHLLREPLRPVRDRAFQNLMQPPSSRGPAMSRACPRPGLRKLVTGSQSLAPTGRPLMTQGWTRALVEGKEPGCGAGCGGRGDFPLRRGVMFICSLQVAVVAKILAPISAPLDCFSGTSCVKA